MLMFMQKLKIQNFTSFYKSAERNMTFNFALQLARLFFLQKIYQNKNCTFLFLQSDDGLCHKMAAFEETKLGKKLFF